MMNNTTIITNIMAALGQDELKELIGALQGMVDAPETVQKHWEPTEGEQYFYLWGTGKKDGGVFTAENQKDVMRLAVGNCFKTEEERDAAAEYLMIVAELKRFAIDHNDEIDWDDHSQRNTNSAGTERQRKLIPHGAEGKSQMVFTSALMR